VEKTGQGIARGTSRTHSRSQGYVQFINLGKTIEMLRFALVQNQLVFYIDMESSFVFGE
jgi:hypothetical protein